MIEGLMRLMNTSDDVTGPVNLGNPSEISILELAEKVIKITHSRSKIVFKALPQDDPVRRCPDIRLAKKILKWKPRVSLDEGLEKTAVYFGKVLYEK
jgi:UDP-glucuronate decarboxylase